MGNSEMYQLSEVEVREDESADDSWLGPVKDLLDTAELEGRLDRSNTIVADDWSPNLPPLPEGPKNPSDRNIKENIRVVDPQELLRSVATVPVYAWNYIAEPRNPHIGPMAQEFAAALGVGNDPLAISTVDAYGVALGAIQGLYQRLQDSDSLLAEAQQRIADLERQVERLASSR